MMAGSPGSMNGPLYRKGSTSAVRLGVRLGSGGEGEVWELLDDPVRVLKLYRKTDEDRRRKIESMLAAVPDDPQRTRNHVSICWPDELILDATGEMGGFTMPRMDLKRFKPAAIYWDAHDRAVFAPGFTWKYLCVAAANIASVVDMIHARGHVIGDLNDENFLLSESALATVVDCDSMQIRCPTTGELFRSPVTREPYLSPEWIGKKLADHDRSPNDDNWALAVLVFQLLMEGHHPTNGIGFPEERRDRIRQGIFPMLGAAGFQPPKDAHALTVLSPQLQALARQCFEAGHSDPDVRPTAHDWKTALNSFAGSLHQCTQVGEHWYGPHLAACPWCEEKVRNGYDRFAFDALASGLQTQLPPATRTGSRSSAASGGTPSVPASTAAARTQLAPSGSPKAAKVVGSVLAAAGVIFMIIILLVSSNGSGKETAAKSPAYSPSSSTFAQPAVSSQSSPAAQEPAAPQPATTSVFTSSPASAPQQQTANSAGPTYPVLDQSMAVPPIPFQPVAVSGTTPFEGPHISFSYPTNWTTTPNKDGSVFACQADAVRILANGEPWCYYNVIIGFAGSTSAEGQPLTEAQVLTLLSSAALGDGSKAISNSPNSDLEGGGIEVIQTVQTPLSYVEKRMFIIWPFSNHFAWCLIGAPADQWNTAYPILERIYRSAKVY